MASGQPTPEDCAMQVLCLRVSGTVQGVGFRPFVYSLATAHGLSGFVRNSGGLVDIVLQGRSVAIDVFLAELKSKAPPLAVIDQIQVLPDAAEMLAEVLPGSAGCGQAAVPPAPGRFVILPSRQAASAYQMVPPDTATCADCCRELFDPGDRRYRYPFINCTNCGPRFTIIRSLPYDRPATTMAAFPMCPACKAEYDDPANRRFHAQPNACPDCGPSLTFVSSAPNSKSCDAAAGGAASNDAETGAAREAVTCLRAGKTIALKGLGGFHLACDATCNQAVDLLRQRKHREGKPLAVMFPSLAMLKEYCAVTPEEEKILTGSRRPIVLVRSLDEPGGLPLAAGVSPGLDVVGAMLPYTPVHHILLADFAGPLVMTSGNLSEEPICIDNEEALERLEGLCDGFLFHDRLIEARYDDSVVRVVGGVERVIRRARGYAPELLRLPLAAELPVLAFGAQLKNTFCFIDGERAFLSQHIGDLDNLETEEHFLAALDKYVALFKLEAKLVTCDMHPDYLSTRLAQNYARQHNLPLVAVQHHHAHIVSCMMEHGLTEPVIGVSFDGLGWGMDGTAWGGEFLVADLGNFTRAGCFRPVPMPGGELAIKQPWRMALGYLLAAEQPGAQPGCSDAMAARFNEAMVRQFGEQAVRIIRQQIERGINAPATSSCGRLFDAVSALAGICLEASYEGEAAVLLEVCARQHGECDEEAYSFMITERQQPSGAPEEASGSGQVDFYIEPASILAGVCGDLLKGEQPGKIAWKFHATVAEIALAACVRLRLQRQINRVCLGGGVFQNAILLEQATRLLVARGFEVFTPGRVPANDGGLSLGQAVVAASVSNVQST
jgi:hydrogenase maturation protein HypF